MKIPAFEPKQYISAPRGTVSVVCKIAVAGYHIHKKEGSGFYSTEIQFDFNSQKRAALTIPFLVPTSKGSLVLIAVSLQFMIPGKGGVKVSNAKDAHPAGIISAVYL